MQFVPGSPIAYWYTLTRFGESGILLPCGLLIGAWLALHRRQWAHAWAWLLPLGAAVLLTTASKIAFIGFGIGVAALDFTGFSGHSMFSAAVYPMLGYAFACAWARPFRVAAVLAGYGMALLVMLSRYYLGVHSGSEVVLGFLLGALASGTALFVARDGGGPGLPALVVAAVALWLWAATSPREPLLNSHEIVTRISLKLSGRTEPYTRADLHLGRQR
jgi:membrane-associated phospholipid phosphatase